MNLIPLPEPTDMAQWLRMGLAEYTGIVKFPFHPSKDAPNSWAQLKQWGASNRLGVDSLPVFQGGSDHSIYGSPMANHIFRAWHDTVHLKEGLSFSLDDEIKVSDIHCATLRYLGAPYNVVKALEADVKGQILYFHETGCYVQNQKLFVMDCLKYSIETVIYFVNQGTRY